ncbi:MAG: polysaccharide biosynthesis tyrosine autokinase [Alphaproteobacteria bacterium]|nr:polysaccharide biosynthesis tyrosine autokinase [Alphaproteobacteria bacterium]
MYLAQDSARGPQAVEERPQPVLQPVGEVDLQELTRKLWRRKWVILGAIVTVVILTVLVLSQLTPRYTAVNQVEINPRLSAVVDFEAVLAGLPADSATMETELHIIRSRNLIAKTIERLKLARNPEFNAVLRPPSAMKMLKMEVRNYLAQMGLELSLDRSDDKKLTQKERTELERAKILDSLLERLKVSSLGLSRVVAIEFESESAATAALVANTLADFYIVAQLEAKFDATKRANTWLNDRVLELRQEVSVAARAVAVFRERSGLVRGGTNDVTLASEQISTLGTQYIMERTALAAAEARLRQVERLLKSADGVESASEVLASDLIRSLREQEAELERQVAELSAELGERHPRMINARAQLRDLRGKIRIEVGRIVGGLRNEVGVARARTATLKNELDKLKKEIAQLDKYQVQLQALEREATASQSLLEILLIRSKETASQQSFQEADANILSYAATPEYPSFPKKGIVVAGATVFGAILGLLLAFVMEQLDQGFRSMEQVERMMGIIPLGLVPRLAGLGLVGKKPERYVLEKPASAYGEAIRKLHTSLLLLGPTPPKKILFCSSLPKEGKTTMVVSLARMLASVGQKVIVVDCDLRRPTVHTTFGLSPTPGLIECLSGDVELEEAIQKDPLSGAYVLAAGAPAAHPPNLLGSLSMERLLDGFAQEYDFVLIDSAPVMAVSDSLILSRLVDTTVFLVRWTETRRETAFTAVRQIIDAGGDLAGILLTMVDVKEHAQYGFGDSGSYTGTIKKYYSG